MLIKDLEYVISSNMTFRREVFDKVGGFNPFIGGIGRNFQANDEILFLEQAKKLGLKVGFYPDMTVAHYVPENRIGIDYLKRRFHGQGISEIKKERLLGKSQEEIMGFFENETMDSPWSLDLYRKMKDRLNEIDRKIYQTNFFKTRLAYLNGIKQELFQEDKK